MIHFENVLSIFVVEIVGNFLDRHGRFALILEKAFEGCVIRCGCAWRPMRNLPAAASPWEMWTDDVRFRPVSIKPSGGLPGILRALMPTQDANNQDAEIFAEPNPESETNLIIRRNNSFFFLNCRSCDIVVRTQNEPAQAAPRRAHRQVPHCCRSFHSAFELSDFCTHSKLQLVEVVESILCVQH